ncbi:DUF4230 domain-containing protein [Mangrovimonas cancribranchiae]|uniref:DUF4230 domain-containing protein n=1 Tax=Mangrovimonas cancribranchiae TaxID=3080055 RepID=A0AAU6NZ68_9FLAO
MRKILFGVLITLIILFTFKYCDNKKEEKYQLKENTALIQKQIKNVGKLVVTEGHFSQVFNYKNSKTYFGDWLNAEKKALVVVNTDVSIVYDLSLLEYNIDETTKTLEITHIPKEQIKIHPDLEYYDVQADFFNQFEAEDHNKIRAQVKQSLLKKIEQSDLKTNAQNRLISELSKFYILTNSLGWTLKYNNNTIANQQDFQDVKL